MPGAEEAVGVVRAPLTRLTGRQLTAGLRTALAWLDANKEAVNDLNVFPVPDGDTGSNMFLTMRSAVEEAQHAADPSSASSVMLAAAHGSLMGARGNSGVILSQIFRGFAQGLQNRAEVDAATVAAALGEASAVAYRAVMKPTEGTILTVVREAADAAQGAAEEGGDVRAVLERAVGEAHAAVERTIDQLAVLREAGVVDAGGFGFAVILEGLFRAMAEVEGSPSAPPQPLRPGEPRVRTPGASPALGRAPGRARRGAAAVSEREEGWGYCTEFLISGSGMDVDSLRERLAALGDSALIVGDGDLVRVHIHTREPATLIAAASQAGRLSRLKVEDMSSQHHEILERADAAGGAAEITGRPAAARRPLGIVTVATGGGFRQILESLGAEVVEGGQTMNPSIEDLLNGVRAANADHVIILPNNGNVILTAEQVDGLAEGVDVRVVPTRNVPQGISALLAVEAGAGSEANCELMTGALGSVRAVEITRAVRDSAVNGLDIREGDVIGLLDDEIVAVGSVEAEVADAVLRRVEPEPELVTVYRGAGVGEEAAGHLVEALRRSRPKVEFEVHDGGQEHYPFVLSLE